MNNPPGYRPGQRLQKYTGPRVVRLKPADNANDYKPGQVWQQWRDKVMTGPLGLPPPRTGEVDLTKLQKALENEEEDEPTVQLEAVRLDRFGRPYLKISSNLPTNKLIKIAVDRFYSATRRYPSFILLRLERYTETKSSYYVINGHLIPFEAGRDDYDICLKRY